MGNNERRPLILPHGGYRNLRSFQCAQLVYDLTVVFCDRFIDRRSRTHDQMVQAARSGVQNIAEGSVASGTSKKTEIKLTNVARASLEELLLDYEDFLRQRGMQLWSKDSPEAVAVRQRRYEAASSYGVQEATSETAANTLICLVNQASYLLGRQLQTLEQQFLNEGGFTERLYTERSRSRGRTESDESDRSDPSDKSPECPRCGSAMVIRRARQTGQEFWGCSTYPKCAGTRPR